MTLSARDPQRSFFDVSFLAENLFAERDPYELFRREILPTLEAQREKGRLGVTPTHFTFLVGPSVPALQNSRPLIARVQRSTGAPKPQGGSRSRPQIRHAGCYLRLARPPVRTRTRPVENVKCVGVTPDSPKPPRCSAVSSATSPCIGVASRTRSQYLSPGRHIPLPMRIGE